MKVVEKPNQDNGKTQIHEYLSWRMIYCGKVYKLSSSFDRITFGIILITSSASFNFAGVASS